MKTDRIKILIIKPSSLGDVIHALPFLKAIKNTFPQAHVEWVVSKGCEGVLAGNPLIDELIVFDKDSWKYPKDFSKTFREIKKLKRALSAKYFDMVIDLQGLLRTGLMAFLTHSPLKIGFEHAREGSRFFYNKKVSVSKDIHAVDRYLEVARAIGATTATKEFPLYIDESARDNIKKLLGDVGEYVVLVPSARWETKRWPAEYFGLLVSKVSHPCIVTGSDADIKTAQEVMRVSKGKAIDLCDKTNMKELITLIAGSRAMVSNDSGPMHVGAALGIPLIALFGPTDPERTGPYGWKENMNFRVLRAGLSCSPCFKKKCKDPLCMSKISVEMVLEELKEYL